MNIIQYFESNPQEKILVWRGRIFQPVWEAHLTAAIMFVAGVLETDSDLSYYRYISRTWYEN